MLVSEKIEISIISRSNSLGHWHEYFLIFTWYQIDISANSQTVSVFEIKHEKKEFLFSLSLSPFLACCGRMSEHISNPSAGGPYSFVNHSFTIRVKKSHGWELTPTSFSLKLFFFLPFGIWRTQRCWMLCRIKEWWMDDGRDEKVNCTQSSLFCDLFSLSPPHFFTGNIIKTKLPKWIDWGFVLAAPYYWPQVQQSANRSKRIKEKNEREKEKRGDRIENTRSNHRARWRHHHPSRLLY